MSAMDHFFIIEADPLVAAQHVNLLFIRERGKTARLAYGLKNGGGRKQFILTGPADLTVHVIFLAQDILHGDIDQRVYDVLYKSVVHQFLYLDRRLSPGLYIAH